MYKRKRSSTWYRRVKRETEQFVFDQIPITTPDGLAYIESLIAEKTSFNLLLTDFSRLGAANYKELIRRIMRQLMTDSVAKLYSVHGHKGKTSFSKTTCFRAVIGAVQIHNRNVTSKDVELVMGQWLAKASERLKKTSLEETNR
ncbi:unnamed protein product [Psylliodes chrysocephalus]|nr:unnamed protein product [Psylliodes chrysocephala]